MSKLWQIFLFWAELTFECLSSIDDTSAVLSPAVLCLLFLWRTIKSDFGTCCDLLRVGIFFWVLSVSINKLTQAIKGDVNMRRERCWSPQSNLQIFLNFVVVSWNDATVWKKLIQEIIKPESMDITDDKHHDHFLSWPSYYKGHRNERKRGSVYWGLWTFFAPGN